ncbi:MAG: DNA mismatch repair protein MutS [Nitrospinota bacterium]|nr:MAG: DNA mismatch repair protein MutS [Nitrospinota bacterium]
MVTDTPMMQQYRRLKKEYPHSILLFRMGDFYEMFDDDAKIAARVLDIALTSRDKHRGNPTPMCGVPYHAVEGYIDRLIKEGFTVAICEQVEDPKLAKGLVKREVVRVVTPGTLLNSSLLEAKENNFLASLSYLPGKGIGLAFLDLSTGEFRLTEIRGEKSLTVTQDELHRLRPREILLPKGVQPQLDPLFRQHDFPCTLTPLDDWSFDYDTAYHLLTSHFATVSLDGFGCADAPLAVAAAGAVLQYLRETQKSTLNHINRLSYYHPEGYMYLDAGTQRNLELFRSGIEQRKQGSLLSLLDQTLTPMGGRKLTQWLLHPLLDLSTIRDRQTAVEELVQNFLLREEIRQALKGIHDLERLISKVNMGVASPRDLVALKLSLTLLPSLALLLQQTQAPLLVELYTGWDNLTDVCEEIDRVLVEDPPLSPKEGGLIKSGFHPELDELRQICHDGKHWLAALEAREREQTGIPTLKVGYNKVFGYYIEVSKRFARSVPPTYQRRQTLVNAERFITPELKALEEKVLGAEERINTLEYQLFEALRERVARETPRIQQAAQRIADLDVLSALAEIAHRYHYVKPEVHTGETIEIRGGRHPVLEQYTEERFVPNDTFLDCDTHRILIITGPNMAGKSTYLRQVALIVLLAQIGSFVPAEQASIGIVDRIFTRVGAHDHLIKGQSTFMVEMHETANILHHATKKSLVILDEVGRGTSTYDGVSIAWAVVEYLYHTIGAKTLFATHYHELTDLAVLPGVENWNVAVQETAEGIVFLRKIKPGATNKSYGIQVAQLAGLPGVVIQRAREILARLESEHKSPPSPSPAALPDRHDVPVQLPLFTWEEHPVLKELAAIDIARTTPLEALLKLDAWQKILGKESRKDG